MKNVVVLFCMLVAFGCNRDDDALTIVDNRLPEFCAKHPGSCPANVMQYCDTHPGACDYIPTATLVPPVSMDGGNDTPDMGAPDDGGATPCGDLEQACCDDNVCNDGLVCSDGTCSPPPPPPCGGVSEACCEGSVCDSGLVCDDGTCFVNGSSCDAGYGWIACTLTLGYFKNHACWPLSYLQLGSRVYDFDELNSILNKMPGGNGLVSLAQQLIAAKLNLAAGADASSLGTAISDADLAIGGLVVPPVGTDWLDPVPLETLNATLNSFNSGTLGSPHCN